MKEKERDGVIAPVCKKGEIQINFLIGKEYGRNNKHI